MSTNGGSQVELALPLTIGTTVGSGDARTASITPLLAPGSTYRFSVAARDNAGNWGSASGTTFTVDAYQEASSSITYSGDRQVVSGR